MAFSDELVAAYLRAKKLRPGLTKGQFMQEAYVGRYKNEESAAAGFRKVESGKTSGKILEREGTVTEYTGGKTGPYYMKVGPKSHRRYRGIVNKKGERALAGTELGFWKVAVTFVMDYDDAGNEIVEVKSFTADSSNLLDVIDAPEVTGILQDAIEQHIEAWMDQYTNLSGYLSYRYEVFPVERSSVPEERLVHLDQLMMGEPYEPDE